MEKLREVAAELLEGDKGWALRHIHGQLLQDIEQYVSCVCVRSCAYSACVCMRVCANVCVRGTHLCVWYMCAACIYVCVCACVHVCVRAYVHLSHS